MVSKAPGLSAAYVVANVSKLRPSLSRELRGVGGGQLQQETLDLTIKKQPSPRRRASKGAQDAVQPWMARRLSHMGP